MRAGGASRIRLQIHLIRSTRSPPLRSRPRALHVDKARAIRLEGSNFTVLNKQLGELSVTGQNNTLNLTNVDSVDIQGNQNLVLAREVKQVRFSGNDNTVNPSSKPALDDRGRGNKVM